MSEQTPQFDVVAITEALRVTFPQLVYGDAELLPGQVRLHYAGYDEGKGAFKPYEGLVATRRRWHRQPEPTLIFGFESVEFLQLSPEAAILKQDGVVYLPYTASVDEVRWAIDAVLNVSLATQDDCLAELGKRDFLKKLADFGHISQPNIINSLTIRRTDLVSKDTEIKKRRYQSFQGMKPDYISAKNLLFESLLTKFNGTPIVEQYQTELERIRKCLERADKGWRELLIHVQGPFSDGAVNTAEKKVTSVIATLKKMYAMTKEIRSQLDNPGEEE